MATGIATDLRQQVRNIYDSIELPKYKTVKGLSWLIPVNVLYIPFLVVPAIGIFILSLFRWTTLNNLRFAGIDNYVWLLTDSAIITVLGNTFFYSLANTTLTAGGGLVLALILKATYPRLRKLIQLLLLIPFAIMPVGVGLVWAILYHPRNGVINTAFVELGIDSQPLWLSDPSLALPSIITAHVWYSIGFYAVIWLVGLNNINEVYYEAARIDGASQIEKFRYITLPLLKPIALFLFIISFVTSLRTFDLVWVMTQGGPDLASEVLATYMYRIAFMELNMGRASAVGITLFVFTLLVAILNIKYFGLSKGY